MADHQRWLARIHPDDRDRVFAEVRAAQMTGTLAPSEYRMLARDGQLKWFRDVGTIAKDADGRPRFLQGVMFDITDRKLAEANRAYGRQFGIVFDLSNRLQPGAARVNVDPDRLLQALTNMFQKFAQADASDTRQRGGTGLGLSITKAIVEKLGGAISYETRIGRGTTFFLDLPEWRDTPPQDYSDFLI
jgi:signal transduction histidine kinase